MKKKLILLVALIMTFSPIASAAEEVSVNNAVVSENKENKTAENKENKAEKDNESTTEGNKAEDSKKSEKSENKEENKKEENKEENKKEDKKEETKEENKGEKTDDKKKENKEDKKEEKRELTEAELESNYVFNDGTVEKPEGWVEVTIDAGDHCGFYVQKDPTKNTPLDKKYEETKTVEKIKFFVKPNVEVEIFKSQARKYRFAFMKIATDTKFELTPEYKGTIKRTFKDNETIKFEYKDHSAQMGWSMAPPHYIYLTDKDGKVSKIDVKADRGDPIGAKVDEIRKHESDNTIGWEYDYGQDEGEIDGKKIPKIDAKRILVLGSKYKNLENNLVDITNDDLYGATMGDLINKVEITADSKKEKQLHLKEIVKKENERTVMIVEPTENHKYRLISFKVYGPDFKLNMDEKYNYSKFDLENMRKLGKITDDTELKGDIIILQEKIGMDYNSLNYTPPKKKQRPSTGRISFVTRVSRTKTTRKKSKNFAVLSLKTKSFSVSGKNENVDALPVVEKGKVLIPLKYVAKSYGFDLKWDKENEILTLVKEGKKIVIPTSGNVIYVNDEPIILDFNIEFKDGNIYFSIENIIKALGLDEGDIVWDEKEQTLMFGGN